MNYTDNMQTGIGWRTKIMPESPNAPAVWTPGIGRTGGGALVGQFAPGGAGWQIRVRIDMGQDCFIQGYEVWHRKLSGATAYDGVIVRVYTEAGAMVWNQTIRSGNTANTNWIQDLRFTGLTVGRHIDFIFQTNNNGGGLYADDITVYT